MLEYYKSYKSEQLNEMYSLDMVRLNFDLGDAVEEFSKYLQHIDTYDVHYNVEHHQSYASFKYRHLWAIQTNECGWKVGLDLGRSADDKRKGFIEFNPNKCMKDRYFLAFWRVFEINTCTRDLVRYDMAIDIPIPRSQVCLVREGRRIYKCVIGDEGSTTEYLGVHNTSGFTKLYDKTAESKLEEDLTRLELTLEKRADLENLFPKVLVTDYQISLDLDNQLSQNELVFVSAINTLPNKQWYVSQLTYRMRKKLEPYLADRVLTLNNRLAQEIKMLALSFES